MKRFKTVLRWTLHFKRYDLDCVESCGVGRCHWCLLKPGSVKLRVLKDGRFRTHRACDAHANVLARQALNIGSRPDEQALGPAVLRASQ